MEILYELKLNKEDPQHLYIQLYSEIKKRILQGQLRGEDRLPPIRKLAQALGVNNVTVVRAYQILEQEGLVYKKIGSGSYVSNHGLKAGGQKLNPKQREEQQGNGSLMEQGHIQIGENTINFASATPTAALFPVEDFKVVLNQVLDRDGGKAFGYQESQGFYPLRSALKKYIENYGIHTDIHHIQVISGAQQGIDIISKALINYGDCVLVESPSYTGALAAFQSRGAKIVDIPLVEDGLDLEDLEKKIGLYQPKFLYIMPNFQNPTGISYSREKKMKILEICERHHLLIVEDDYLSELNFYASDYATLKSLDKKDRVIYVKSFSKIFMPGLRLGFLVVPPWIVEDVLLAKHSSDISSSGLLQRALALYLEKGIWQKHIRYMESQYKERFDHMLQCIRAYLPKEVEYMEPKGGVNFWMKLPKGASSRELYERAIKEGVAFAPGNLFFLHNGDSPYFRISIAAVSKEEIEMGIKKLSGLIQSYLRDSGHRSYTPIL